MDQQEHVQHICESQLTILYTQSHNERDKGEALIRTAVETAYIQLKQRVKALKSVLLSVTQTVSTECVSSLYIVYIVTLTAAIVSVEEVDRQRRMQQFSGMNGLRTN